MRQIRSGLLTSADVEEILGISRATLYKWIKMGKLTPIKVVGQLRFREQNIMALIGKLPSTSLWIAEGTLDSARIEVKNKIRGGADPLIYVEYISDPSQDRIIVKVLSPISPGGTTWNALVDCKNKSSFVFLGSEESVWHIDDIRSERAITGKEFVAIYLVRVRSERSEMREQKIKKAIAVMQEGIIAGKIARFKRDDLYERDTN